MTAEPTIDYEALAQEAMRGVVRTVLIRTAKDGLAGDHHFYISFDTTAPGVSLSKRLKEKYPREMTIVLQHRFWDLAVAEDRFEVKLTFDGIPERIVVPFAAIKVFFDPSVRYGLQFEDPNLGPDTSAHSQAANALDSLSRTSTVRSSQARKGQRPARKTRIEQSGADMPHAATSPLPEASHPKSQAAGAKETEDGAGQKGEKVPGGAEIVSLDKFRKK